MKFHPAGCHSLCSGYGVLSLALYETSQEDFDELDGEAWDLMLVEAGEDSDNASGDENEDGGGGHDNNAMAGGADANGGQEAAADDAQAAVEAGAGVVGAGDPAALNEGAEGQ